MAEGRLRADPPDELRTKVTHSSSPWLNGSIRRGYVQVGRIELGGARPPLDGAGFPEAPADNDLFILEPAQACVLRTDGSTTSRTTARRLQVERQRLDRPERRRSARSSVLPPRRALHSSRRTRHGRRGDLGCDRNRRVGRSLVRTGHHQHRHHGRAGRDVDQHGHRRWRRLDRCGVERSHVGLGHAEGDGRWRQGRRRHLGRTRRSSTTTRSPRSRPVQRRPVGRRCRRHRCVRRSRLQEHGRGRRIIRWRELRAGYRRHVSNVSRTARSARRLTIPPW